MSCGAAARSPATMRARRQGTASARRQGLTAKLARATCSRTMAGQKRAKALRATERLRTHTSHALFVFSSTPLTTCTWPLSITRTSSQRTKKTHPFLHTFACRFKFRGITSTPQPTHFERTFRCMSSRCCFSLMLLANFAPQEKQVNSTPPQQGSFSTEQVPQSGLGGTGRVSNLAAAASITWRLVELSWKNSPHWGANSANSCCSSTRPPAKRAITRTSSGPSLPQRSVGCLLVQKWQTLCQMSDVPKFEPAIGK